MRIIVAEGSPDELARYEELTGLMQVSSQPAEARDDPGDGIDREIVDFLASRAGTKSSLEIARAFVSRALDRGDITASPGTSKSSKDGYNRYVRLYKIGPRLVGAVVYYSPSSGVADFRLPKEAAQDRSEVEVRYPERDGEYNIRLRVDSLEKVDLALRLLDEAVRHSEE